MATAFDIPTVDVFALDERDVRVPAEWSARFRRAEQEDRRNARPGLFGVVMEPWTARNAACDEFIKAVADGLEVEPF